MCQLKVQNSHCNQTVRNPFVRLLYAHLFSLKCKLCAFHAYEVVGEGRMVWGDGGSLHLLFNMLLQQFPCACLLESPVMFHMRSCYLLASNQFIKFCMFIMHNLQVTHAVKKLACSGRACRTDCTSHVSKAPTSYGRTPTYIVRAAR